MHAQVLLCIYENTKFEVPSFTDSKDMTGVILKNFKTGYVILTTPTYQGVVCHPKAST